MAFDLRTVLLRGDTPGETTEFNYYVIGAEDAPEKVHLQAALHADEQPGTHHEEQDESANQAPGASQQILCGEFGHGDSQRKARQQ